MNDKGGGQNFERANVEQPIFRIKKLAVSKVTRGPIIRFFHLRNCFFHFFLNYFNTQILVVFFFFFFFSNFNAPIFYNFENLIFFVIV